MPPKIKPLPVKNIHNGSVLASGASRFPARKLPFRALTKGLRQLSKYKEPEKPTTPLKLRPGPHCKTCRHSERLSIDLDLIGGASKREVAEKYGLSASSVQRHKDHCVPKDLIQAEKEKRLDRSQYVAARLRGLQKEAEEISAEARKHRELGIALAGIGEQRRLLSFENTIPASQDASRPNAQAEDAEVLKKEIRNALKNFPEARAAVAEALSKKAGT